MVEVEVQIMFTFFFKKVIPTEIPPSKCKIYRKNFLKFSKKLFKGLSIMFGQWKKWFLAPLKRLFHHFQNIFQCLLNMCLFHHFENMFQCLLRIYFKWLVDFNPGKTHLVSFDRFNNNGSFDVKMGGFILE